MDFDKYIGKQVSIRVHSDNHFSYATQHGITWGATYWLSLNDTAIVAQIEQESGKPLKVWSDPDKFSKDHINVYIDESSGIAKIVDIK